MRNYQRQFILLTIACLIAATTWVIIDKKLLASAYVKLFQVFFGPVTAGYVFASLPRMFGLPDIITKAFMAIVAVLGWYCPIALIAMRKFPLSKRNKIFCIAAGILIWILPIVGYIASKCE
jgi:hypothetical protein